MKKILPLIFLFLFNFCLGQEKLTVNFVSKTEIVGSCKSESTVFAHFKSFISKKDTIKKVIVPANGNFKLLFKESLNVNDSVKIWAVYNRILKSDKKYDTIFRVVQTEQEIINAVTKKLTETDDDLVAQIEKISELNHEKEALKNTTLIYRTTIVSTNFSIPLVRFNFVRGDDSKEGDVLLFNSIGAGVGYYGGRLERTRDDRGEIVNEEFSNSWGFNIGALFSAGTGEDTKNVFAPVLNFSALDFQVGFGWELGNVTAKQNRGFLTLSYAIPLYKLFKKSYRITRGALKPMESTRKSQG